MQIYMPKMISHRSHNSSTEEVAEISMRQRDNNNLLLLTKSSMDVETQMVDTTNMRASQSKEREE